LTYKPIADELVWVQKKHISPFGCSLLGFREDYEVIIVSSFIQQNYVKEVPVEKLVTSGTPFTQQRIVGAGPSLKKIRSSGGVSSFCKVGLVDFLEYTHK